MRAFVFLLSCCSFPWTAAAPPADELAVARTEDGSLQLLQGDYVQSEWNGNASSRDETMDETWASSSRRVYVGASGSLALILACAAAALWRVLLHPDDDSARSPPRRSLQRTGVRDHKAACTAAYFPVLNAPIS